MEGLQEQPEALSRRWGPSLLSKKKESSPRLLCAIIFVAHRERYMLMVWALVCLVNVQGHRP